VPGGSYTATRFCQGCTREVTMSLTVLSAVIRVECGECAAAGRVSSYTLDRFGPGG
jgi:hypothetical protein